MIPKDGKSYLAWHVDLGFMFVFNVGWGSLYHEFNIQDQGHELKMFTRYMNEHGQWIEINQEHSNMPKPALTTSTAKELADKLREINDLLWSYDKSSFPNPNSRSWSQIKFYAEFCADMLEGEVDDEI